MLGISKRFLLERVAQVLHATGWLARQRTASKLTVLTFHRVLPEEMRGAYPLPALAVTPDELSWILEQVRGSYACGSLRTSIDRWRNPEPGALPPLAVTFDDCTVDSHRFARPVLAEHGVLASFFAPAELIESGETLWHDRMGFAATALAAQVEDGGEEAAEGRRWLAARGISSVSSALPRDVVTKSKSVPPAERQAWLDELEALRGDRHDPEWARLMNWQEMRDLAADGHEVGSHSQTHALLPQLEPGELREEIEGSRSRLVERLGAEVTSFCYPNGDHDSTVVEAVQRGGYEVAVTTRGGTNLPNADPFRLRRFDMRLEYATDAKGEASLPLLLFRISGFHPAA
jgi:peptidoglycan/xylan/chitin deacetylase (PgdA/CDA1 family)